MPFAFRVVFQLTQEFPDRDSAAVVARQLARRIPEARLLRVVSNLSDDIGQEEVSARDRNKTLPYQLPALEDDEDGS